ncbi:MAG TPA: PAS domain-containing protein, partial [Thermoanaerobaculia bacterium]|nr:PAS domain-containing protein [Thermoanaerobaculia bacterium]
MDREIHFRRGHRMAGKPGICDEELFRLVQLIYEAAEDAALWPILLERMAVLLPASVGTLDFYDLAHKSGNVAASFNVDPEFIRGYNDYFARKNLWLNYSPGSVPPVGKAVVGQMLVPDDVLFRSEFYQDFLRQRDIFHLAGGRILEKDTLTANVSFLRPRSAAPFGDRELAFFDRLLPHLQQSLKLHQRIADAAALQSASADALDRIPIGVLVVDACSRVLSANRRATEILGAHDGISSGTGGLRAAVPS